MNASSLLILALAVFGASAAPCCSMNNLGLVNGGSFGGLNNGGSCGLNTVGINSVGLNSVNTVGTLGGLNTMNNVNTAGNFGGLNAITALNAVNAVNGVSGGVTALQAPNAFVQTAVVENPASFVPSILPSTSVSKSCHCVKTFVRPQVRNEYYTVPSVDRLTRIVTTPVVDVASNTGCLVGNGRNLETIYPNNNGMVSGGVLGGCSNGLVSGNVLGGVSNGFGNGFSNGLVSGNVLGGCSNGLVSGNVLGGVSNGFSNGFANGNVLGQENGCGCGNVF